MKALSIRQPWASLILKAHKDIENRCWPTKVRGRILIHAAKGMTRGEHENAIEFAVDAIRADPRNSGCGRVVTLRELEFAFDDLQRGGIVGIERERKYFEVACRRIEDAQRVGDMFGHGDDYDRVEREQLRLAAL